MHKQSELPTNSSATNHPLGFLEKLLSLFSQHSTTSGSMPITTTANDSDLQTFCVDIYHRTGSPQNTLEHLAETMHNTGSEMPHYRQRRSKALLHHQMTMNANKQCQRNTSTET